MNAVIITAVIARLKALLLAAIADWKTKLPDAMKPLADQVAAFIGSLLDGLDVAALEQDTIGRLLELAKTGQGPSASSGVDTA